MSSEETDSKITKDDVNHRIECILTQFGNYTKERRLKNFISNRIKLRDAYKPIYFSLQSVSKNHQKTACKNMQLLKLLSYYGLHEEIEGLFSFFDYTQPAIIQNSLVDFHEQMSYLWLSQIALKGFEIFCVPFDENPSFFTFLTLCICTQHKTWNDRLLDGLLCTTFISTFNTHIESNKSSFMGVLLSSWSDLLLGYFMICASEKIHFFMTDKTMQQSILNRTSTTHKLKFKNVKQHYHKISTVSKMQKFGISLFCKSFQIMKEFKFSPETDKNVKFWNTAGITNQMMYYMCGVVYDHRSMQTGSLGDVSIRYLMLSATQRQDAMIRYLSLQHLSQICSRNGYNLMGLKALKSADKISCRYILCASEVKVGLANNMMPLDVWLKIKWMTSRCENCGKEGPMKCCSGCFKVNYCRKKCQAKHWKSTHRLTCSKQFVGLYAQLKRRTL
eukprot:450693_1